MNSRGLYFRLLSYVRRYWQAFAVSIGCMVLSSAVEPAFPALMKHLLDDGFASARGAWDWLIYPAAIFVIFITRAVLGFAGGYAMSWVSSNVIADLRRAMFDRIVTLPTQYFSDNASGRMMSRVVYDVSGVASAATSTLTTLVKDSVSVLGLLGWLLYLNWRLTLITLVTVPFIALAVRRFGGRLRRISRRVLENQGTMVQVLQEAIEGHKLVKIFGGQAYETERFGHAVREQRSLSMKVTVASSAQGPIVQLAVAIALAAIMGIALYQASSHQTTVGGFVSFITAMLMLLAPLKRLTDINAPIQQGLAAAESVFHLIDARPEDDRGSRELARARGEVVFERVSFTYPGAERPALNGVDFRISPGESVALVGPSGSGKTTVANLLPRFYHPDAGEIRIDGMRLEDIRLASLRENIALVSQEVVLFNDTVAANIAYGARRGASREDIVAAARAAFAMEFIEPLPQGLDTLIGEKGVKLSGGQRQRLAIARALLKDAPVLILDEATSALDSESERIVQSALERLMRGRTTLVIAHRLSTIENADRILVMDKGRVVEAGSHAELLARGGSYAHFHRLQHLSPKPETDWESSSGQAASRS
ncbi:MAG: lipid A export permease/ATP-binding protein MsbA [Betaproteobacteria bacterium CG2_30_68_42]|nr:MAG: lipid A export permease/ATP-binding protein MsbA [Betaproteobacteria bacterium CG2_30_68_42]PIX75951.1 MAG: lipid A export permease/ATP-binding protein MsbA [Rhodocyclales bacterium CG_4_10_14_3_um_filter_68_10]